MLIATVNVNGIRAAVRKGMNAWLAQVQPDLLLLQETRAPEEIIRQLLQGEYQIFANPSEIKGRAGVAIAVRSDIDVERVRFGLPAGLPHLAWELQESSGEQSSGQKNSSKPDCAELDVCMSDEAHREDFAESVQLYTCSGEKPVDTGRWIEIDLPNLIPGGLTLVSAYLHSGAVSQPEKMANKYAYLDRVNIRLSELARPGGSSTDSEGFAHERGLGHVLVAGDFNIVRNAQDIKNWAGNHNKTSGVLDKEIAYLNRWMKPVVEPEKQQAAAHTSMQWVDVQRLLYPCEQGPYTWWSNRGKAFDNDAGWRIDYQMADMAFAQCASEMRVDRAARYEERWSDHAPLVIDYSYDKLSI